ncbi:MAG: ABC transporter permease [Euryarchaeota archaeon]|nr:ABC transporter permease [Euryarchaeota archaeon]
MKDADISSNEDEKIESKQIIGNQIWRIVPYVKSYWKRATLGISTNGFARAFDLIPFVAMGLAVDYYQSGNLTGPSFLVDLISANPELGYGALIFSCFTMLALFQGISDYCWQSLGYKVQHDLRMDATKNLVKMEVSYYDLRQTGALMSILSSDVNQLEDVISDSSTSIIRLVITTLTAFTILFFMSWKLVVVLFGPLLLIFPLVWWFSTRVQRKYRKQRESTGDINSILENLISGISVVQAYNAQKYEVNRVNHESETYRDQAIGASAVRNRFIPGLYAVAGIAFGILVTVGGYLVAGDEISVGNFVTFLLISTRMTFPLFIFGVLLNQLQRGEAAARRVFAITDLEASIYDNPNSQELNKGINSIEFKNVFFTYPETETPVLNGISFKLNHGDFLGIMGHTGAGKSTILKLLLRFYEPDKGEILINDTPIQLFTLESIRNQLGFVSQDPFLFYGTIEDNVVYARKSSEEEVKHALDLAGAKEFVENQEDGLKTKVGGRGVKLSGGQKARISLARALLKNPSLLILDEASSALDAETEKKIQQNLLDSGSGRTTIAVAHRLSTIRNANEILSMVDGIVVERGTHKQLLDSKGVYQSQWQIQTGQLD